MQSQEIIQNNENIYKQYFSLKSLSSCFIQDVSFFICIGLEPAHALAKIKNLVGTLCIEVNGELNENAAVCFLFIEYSELEQQYLSTERQHYIAKHNLNSLFISSFAKFQVLRIQARRKREKSQPLPLFWNCVKVPVSVFLRPFHKSILEQ